MRIAVAGVLATLALSLSACTVLDGARSESRNSSSLVDFLYPRGDVPPPEDAVPRVPIPTRIGLTFLPGGDGVHAAGLEAARKEELLERIRRHFAARKFIGEIVIVPDYYLKGDRGIEGLAGVQRMFGIDLLALVSYDQVAYKDENALSLGYLTIVGAYVLKGNRHEVATLMDLAVVDPASRSIVLRAGGTDSRRDTSTMIQESADVRAAQGQSYSAATDQLITNFDGALDRLEADIRSGKANVKVERRSGAAGAGGGGSLDAAWLAALGLLLLIRAGRTPALPRLCRSRARGASNP